MIAPDDSKILGGISDGSIGLPALAGSFALLRSLGLPFKASLRVLLARPQAAGVSSLACRWCARLASLA